jgi:hypothetical protein
MQDHFAILGGLLSLCRYGDHIGFINHLVVVEDLQNVIDYRGRSSDFILTRLEDFFANGHRQWKSSLFIDQTLPSQPVEKVTNMTSVTAVAARSSFFKCISILRISAHSGEMREEEQRRRRRLSFHFRVRLESRCHNPLVSDGQG